MKKVILSLALVAMLAGLSSCTCCNKTEKKCECTEEACEQCEKCCCEQPCDSCTCCQAEEAATETVAE